MAGEDGGPGVSRMVVLLAKMSSESLQLASEITGKSERDFQRFAAQRLMETINAANAELAAMCVKPGPTIAEKLEVKRVKEAMRTQR